MLQSMGSQRVRHDLVTELNLTEKDKRKECFGMNRKLHRKEGVAIPLALDRRALSL